MISKIIQKERKRQQKILTGCTTPEDKCVPCLTREQVHEQSLISLKEYAEGSWSDLRYIMDKTDDDCIKQVAEERFDNIKEDIEELKKMIEAYNG